MMTVVEDLRIDRTVIAEINGENRGICSSHSAKYGMRSNDKGKGLFLSLKAGSCFFYCFWPECASKKANMEARNYRTKRRY